MRNLIAVLFPLALIAATPVRAQSDPSLDCTGSDPSDCRYLLSATQAFTHMLLTSDPAPLRHHLDPRALWILANGDVRSGAQLIEVVRQDSRRATASLDQARIRFFGDVAVVSWRESWTAPSATVKSGRLAGVDTWVRKRRRWTVVSMVETRPSL